MTKNQQYMKQLNCINNLHNFIVLLALYGDDYENWNASVDASRKTSAYSMKIFVYVGNAGPS